MAEQPLSIYELTEQIKNTLENKFFSVYVVGEISNYKLHSSGHHYFSLKDNSAQISCVIWKTNPVRFKLEDGMKVIVRGNLTVYPPQGKYQIECIQVIPEGIGTLYLAYEKLKQELSEKGYFDQDRKRELTALPLSVGISTSPTGAAIQDMISTIQRRMPLVQIYFRPTIVQGENSAEDIVKAISDLNKFHPDLIIIGRGGGSIEDLWSYNTEIVADAIFRSEAPIISAVGHETDFTIADFVADLRAATPTAAAELCTPIPLLELKSRLNSVSEQITNNLNNQIISNKKIIESIFSNNFYKRFFERIHFLNQRIDDTQNQMEFIAKNKVQNFAGKIDSLEYTLLKLHPLNPLERGFALLKDKKKFLKANEIPKINSELKIIRKNNTIQTKVLSVNDNIFELF